MSEAFMSDSDDEAAADFSASEDEWLPEKARTSANKQRSTRSTRGAGAPILSESESDDEDDSDAEEDEEAGPSTSRKKLAHPRKRGASEKGNTRAPPKSKLSALERKKLYERYRTSGGGAKEDDGSESSGDEHLVNPEQLDLNSDFFTEPVATAVVRNDGEDAPQFDCNAGTRLSDSSSSDQEEEAQSDGGDDAKRKANKALIQKLNKNSQSLVNFAGLDQFNKQIEQAKVQLASFKGRESAKGTEGPAGTSVGDLLALGEHHASAPEKPDKSSVSKKRKKDDSDSDCWEDVEDQEEKRPQQDVQITLDIGPAATQKKKRCNEIDVEACIKRIVNREKRENQVVLHKVNIVMAIGHGNYVNTVLNSSKLMEIALTLIPSQKCYPKDRTNLEFFEQITKFYAQIVDLKEKRMFCRLKGLPPLETSLRMQMLTKGAICKRDYILIFIVLLRAIGVQCRLVMSLVVAPKKLPQAEVSTGKNSKKEDSQAETSGSGKSSQQKKGKSAKDDHDYVEKKTKSTKRKSPSGTPKIPQLDGNDDTLSTVPSKKSKPSVSSKTKTVKEGPKIQEVDMFSPRKTRKQRQEQSKAPAKETSKELKQSKQETASPVPSSSSSILIRKEYSPKPVKDTVPKSSYSKPSTSKAGTPKPSGPDVKPNLPKKQSKDKQLSVEQTPKPKKPPTPSPPKPKILKIEYFDSKQKRRLDRRILSTDDECRSTPENSKPKSGVNLWLEVFAEEEEQWIPIDPLAVGKLHSLEHITRQASSPLIYILAWNNDGSIKDVSPRYCPNFSTVTKKLRIEPEWLEETLAPFRGKRTARDIEEDRILQRALLEQPLPTAISEYKNHPLYALKRHLLKFEGIYPPDAPTLGFVRQEPVYARECVQTLHSREIWLKQARTVKLYETAYKVVTARPKYDRASGQMLPAQPLELFGHWQTQDYDPPTAEDGIVPRNAYGNVELFKPCMLPKKTVHLQLPGLNRVCKKLRIDCAQAVTGFDFHSGSSHPVYDGFVVCEEFKELVVDAWYQEQEQEEKREREKYEKRVYGNWKKLIKGLLIRKRLQHKYNFDSLAS